MIVETPVELRPSDPIDGHVHVFSPDAVAAREQICVSDRWFGDLYTNPRAKLAGLDDLLDSMATARIAVSVLCGFPFADPGLCREHNSYMSECHRLQPERVAWLATVVPGAAGSVAEAEHCLDRGASGIGELNADAQGFDLREPERLAELVELCLARRKPMMLHASEPVGHQYPGKGASTPDRLLRFVERFPDLKVVAAHWGGGLPFYELMPEVAELARNVYYDSAASTYLYRASVFPTVVDLVGSERVVFGSDYPVLRQDRFLTRIKRLGLAPSTYRRVARDNAAGLYGIGERNGPND